MASGYEKPPDYEQFSWPAMIAALTFLVGVASLTVWLVRPAPQCWTLGDDEIEMVEHDGRMVATLDLRRIPPGECVTIRSNAAKHDKIPDGQ